MRRRSVCARESAAGPVLIAPFEASKSSVAFDTSLTNAFRGARPALEFTAGLTAPNMGSVAASAFEGRLIDSLDRGKVAPAAPAQALHASAADSASEAIVAAKPVKKKTAPQKPPRKPAVSERKPLNSVGAFERIKALVEGMGEDHKDEGSQASAAGKKHNVSFEGWSATYDRAAEDAFVGKVKQSFGMETAAPAEAAPAAPSKPLKRQIRKSRSARNAASRLGSMRRDGKNAFVGTALSPVAELNTPVKKTPAASKAGQSVTPEFVFTEPTPVAAAPTRRSRSVLQGSRSKRSAI